jgi:phthalate 4,5-cis-dihydrodiol dehydrogenase
MPLLQTVPRRLRIGVAGLGRAFAVMLPTFLRDPRVELVGAADPRPEARAQFETDFGGKTYESVDALCADPSVEIVYVASPHQHHANQARLAALAGKHVLVEKPMALTLADAEAMAEAASRAGVHLIVGHSHSFDAPILQTRRLINSGAFGAVRMIAALNYTDFLYRPRRPEELDTSRGGGALFNQAPHQVDIVRLIGGGRVKSVRAQVGAWDRTRPTEGAYAALLSFEDGAFASLNYSGYGHFDSDEFQGWIGEMGQAKVRGAATRRARFKGADEESAAKTARNYGGSAWQPPAAQDLAHQHFGTFVVSCEHADLRPLPNGVVVYDDAGSRIEALPLPSVPRAEVIDELYDAVVNGRAPLHDARWGLATLEVCLAMLQSAREGREIPLSHQVPAA